MIKKNFIKKQLGLIDLRCFWRAESLINQEFSLVLPDKINFLMPNSNIYTLETYPKYIWQYPYSYCQSDCEWDNNWKLLSIGFPDTKNKWEIPMFKLLDENGQFILSIYTNLYSQSFTTAENLKNLCWTVNSYF